MKPHQNIIINHREHIMKRFLALIAIASILSIPFVVGAHGSATHILGTVTKATNNKITIKTPKGKNVIIYFSADTIFQKNGITNSNSRPKVGNRLIAETAKTEDRLVAIEVKFSTP